MKKFIGLVLLIVIVAGAVVYGPKLINSCDDCGKTFVGTGYEPNVISDLISSEEQTICEDCAEEQHALSISLGESLESFKKDLFE